MVRRAAVIEIARIFDHLDARGFVGLGGRGHGGPWYRTAGRGHGPLGDKELITPRCIAITGPGSALADGLVRRLLAHAPEVRVVAVGTRLSPALRGRIELLPIDLGEDGAGEELASACQQWAVDVLAHLAFEPAPGETFDGETGWLARAASQLAVAMGRGPTKRLVVASSTMLYGARAENPNFCLEDRALDVQAGSAWLRDQCRAEETLRRIGVESPRREVCVLRSCWPSGPGSQDPILAYLGSRFVPAPMGRDPLVQLIHWSDLLDVYEQAVLEPHPGVFNVVGEGVLPLSRLLAIAGRQRLPLPQQLLQGWPGAPSLGPGEELPGAFFDFLRYLWVADGTAGWREFGRPHYTTQEAWIAFVASKGVYTRAEG